MYVLFIIILMILSILNISVYTGILGIIFILSYFTQDSMILFCSSLVILGFVKKSRKKEGFIDIQYIKSFFKSVDTSLNALNTQVSTNSTNIDIHSQHLDNTNWWHAQGSNNKFCGDTADTNNWNNVDTTAYTQSPTGWQCTWPAPAGSADPPIKCDPNSGLWEANGCCSNPSVKNNWDTNVQDHLSRIYTATNPLSQNNDCIYGGDAQISCDGSNKWTMQKTCCPDPAGNEANWTITPNSDAYVDLDKIRKINPSAATCKYGGNISTSCTESGWTASGCCPNPAAAANWATDSPVKPVDMNLNADPNAITCKSGGKPTNITCNNEKWSSTGCCPLNPTAADIVIQGGGVANAQNPDKATTWSNNKSDYIIQDGAMTCAHAWGTHNATGIANPSATCNPTNNKWTVKGCPGQPTANRCYTRWGPMDRNGIVQNPNVILFKKNTSWHKGSGWYGPNLLISAVTDARRAWDGIDQWKNNLNISDNLDRSWCGKSSKYGGAAWPHSCAHARRGTAARCNRENWCKWAPLVTRGDANPIYGWRGTAADYTIGQEGNDGTWGGTTSCPKDHIFRNLPRPSGARKVDGHYGYNGRANAEYAFGTFGNNDRGKSNQNKGPGGWKPNINLKQCYHDLASNGGSAVPTNQFYFCDVPAGGGDTDGKAKMADAGVNAQMLGTLKA